MDTNLGAGFGVTQDLFGLCLGILHQALRFDLGVADSLLGSFTGTADDPFAVFGDLASLANFIRQGCADFIGQLEELFSVEPRASTS